MAYQSVLIVGGRVDQESDKEKLSKLVYDGLLAAFGGNLEKLDAQFLNCLSKPVNAVDSKEYGLTLEYLLDENIFIRVLCNPTSDQLRFGLQEAFTHAIGQNDSIVEYPVTPSTLGKVCVVYNGQLNGFTGEWLLRDSSFSGYNLLLWLDSEQAMMSWWPYLKKFSNFGDQIHLNIITPFAGTGTCWPVYKSGHPHTILTQINARLVKIKILIEASWRFNGKPLNIHGNLSGFEGLRSFVDQIIINQHPITKIQSDSYILSTGTALNTTRPVIYVFPSHGIASQSCALFAIQGFTALLGGSYPLQSMVPNWWPMVKHLPKLDVALLPDWCASNILTYRFMMELLKSEGHDSASSAAACGSGGILGELLVAPLHGNNISSTEESSDLSTGLILTAPSTISGLHQASWSTSTTTTTSSHLSNDTIPSCIVLYSKLGWGELKLQPLSHCSGLLLILESAVNNFPLHQPLCIVIPSTPPSNIDPMQSLTRFIKGLCQITQLSGPILNRTHKSNVGMKSIGMTKHQLIRNQPNAATRLTNKPNSHSTPMKETIASKTTNSMPTNVKSSPTKVMSSTPVHQQRAPTTTTTTATTATTATTTPSKTSSLSSQLKKSMNGNVSNTKLTHNSHGIDSHPKRPLSSVEMTKKSLTTSKSHSTTTKPVNTELKSTTTTAPTRPSSTSKTTSLTKSKSTTTTTTTAERLTAHSNLVNQHVSKAPPRKSDTTTTAHSAAANKLPIKKTSSLNVKNHQLRNAKPIKEELEINEHKTESVHPSLPSVTLQNISLNNELTPVDPMLNKLMQSSVHDAAENSQDNLSLINSNAIIDNQPITVTETLSEQQEVGEDKGEEVKGEQPSQELDDDLLRQSQQEVETVEVEGELPQELRYDVLQQSQHEVETGQGEGEQPQELDHEVLRQSQQEVETVEVEGELPQELRYDVLQQSQHEVETGQGEREEPPQQEVEGGEVEGEQPQELHHEVLKQSEQQEVDDEKPQELHYEVLRQSQLEVEIGEVEGEEPQELHHEVVKQSQQAVEEGEDEEQSQLSHYQVKEGEEGESQQLQELHQEVMQQSQHEVEVGEVEREEPQELHHEAVKQEVEEESGEGESERLQELHHELLRKSQQAVEEGEVEGEESQELHHEAVKQSQQEEEGESEQLQELHHELLRQSQQEVEGGEVEVEEPQELHHEAVKQEVEEESEGESERLQELHHELLRQSQQEVETGEVEGELPQELHHEAVKQSQQQEEVEEEGEEAESEQLQELHHELLQQSQQAVEEEEAEDKVQSQLSCLQGLQQSQQQEVIIESAEEEYKVHKVIKENQMLAEESDEQLNFELECELKQTTPLSYNDDSFIEGDDQDEQQAHEIVEEQEEEEQEAMNLDVERQQYEQNHITKESIVSSIGLHNAQSYKTPFDTPFDVDEMLSEESSRVHEIDTDKSVLVTEPYSSEQFEQQQTIEQFHTDDNHENDNMFDIETDQHKGIQQSSEIEGVVVTPENIILTHPNDDDNSLTIKQNNETFNLDEQKFSTINNDDFVVVNNYLNELDHSLNNQQSIEQNQISQYSCDDNKDKMLQKDNRNDDKEDVEYTEIVEIPSQPIHNDQNDYLCTDPVEYFLKKNQDKMSTDTNDESDLRSHQSHTMNELFHDNINNVQYVEGEHIPDYRHQDQENDIIEEHDERQQQLSSEQKQIDSVMNDDYEEQDVEKIPLTNRNPIEQVNMIRSNDFLTEIIPLSDKGMIHSSPMDVIQPVGSELITDNNQININLISGEQIHFTEEGEAITDLDDTQYDGGDYVTDHSIQRYDNEQEEGEEADKADDVKVTNQTEELTEMSTENDTPYSIEHYDYVPQPQPIDHEKQQTEEEPIHSDIDEMEKEFIIPSQQKQIHADDDDDHATMDDYHSHSQLSSHEMQSLQQQTIELEKDIPTDNTTLTTTTTDHHDSTTGHDQVDSSTDQLQVDHIIKQQQPKEIDTYQCEEESYDNKVDSTTTTANYDESHFAVVDHDHDDAGDDAVDDDVHDSHVDHIHSNAYEQVIHTGLHVNTMSNIDDYQQQLQQQQQFISPNSEISEDSIMQMSKFHEECEEQVYNDQQDEPHSEAVSSISSPNRPISPNQNIVSSTKHHPNAEEGEEVEDDDENEEEYVGDDIVIHHNDEVIMCQESETDLLYPYDQQYRQKLVDIHENLDENNSTLNGYSVDQHHHEQQQEHLYSEVSTNHSAEIMMPKADMTMSTDVDVTANHDATTTDHIHTHVEEQYLNGNTIYSTDNNIKDDNGDHSAPTTNHYLHNNDIYTNGHDNINVNGNDYCDLKTNEVIGNEDNQGDNNHSNHWNKSTIHYLSETAINDDMNFTNFSSKTTANEYMKAASMAHSYPGEENVENVSEEHAQHMMTMMMSTTSPPPSAATFTTGASPSKDMETFDKFFIDHNQTTPSDLHQNTTSPYCSPTEEPFDPMKIWGHPLGLPAPVPPITSQHSKLPNHQSTLTKRMRSTDTAGRTLTTGDSNDSTLPPGPPVYLDAIWVPSYLVRVPHPLIVEFFIRVRAKLYILSGEALHPSIAEALITAKTKWNPDDIYAYAYTYYFLNVIFIDLLPKMHRLFADTPIHTKNIPTHNHLQ
ncbi:unnamed protein product [Schistosoma turkestanicum]|nr:unnamed protein product [Schistosoma turkestanicum]